ncbi:MAG: hypothetical protein BEN18_06285 [Epulopiscium sp. Nuni2H_MBin001]|nr:MAG: hypothetical protein BEN18_06285 [Epulopiscium sp. Nuni2H_MBin001]
MNVLEILDMTELVDEENVKVAYRKRLKTVNPEDDAEGFKQLRQAYEMALDMLKEVPTITSFNELTDLEQWLEEVKEVYNCFPKRLDIKQWRRLFENDICQGLDTVNEAREALLIFCMANYRVPHEVWELMDITFDIVADSEVLCETFPEHYVEFLVNEITEAIDWLDYSSFSGEPYADYDTYINSAFKLHYRENEEQARQHIKDMDSCNVLSPWGESCKLGFYTFSNNEEDMEVALKIETYLRQHVDMQVLPYLIQFSMARRNFTQAILDCNILLSENPNHHSANYYLSYCYVEMERLDEAEEIIQKLMKFQMTNSTVELYFKLNRLRVDDRKKRLELNPDDNNLKAELAFNYLNIRDINSAFAIAIGMKIEPDDHQYDELFASVYYELGEFDKAKDYAAFALEEQLSKGDDAKIAAAYEKVAMIAYHYGLDTDNEEYYREAIDYLNKSLSLDIDKHSNSRIKIYIALTYYQLEEYETCVQTCKGLDDYMAYKILLRAYYKLNNSHQVWETYKHLIETNAYDPLSYIIILNMAIDMWDNGLALEVLEHLDKLGEHKDLSDDELEFVKLRVQLLFKPNMRKSDVGELIGGMTKIYNRVRKKDDKMPKYLNVIHLERARFDLFLNKYDKVLEHLERFKQAGIATKLEPSYYMLKTEALIEAQQYEVAYEIYCEALQKYPMHMGFLKGMSQCCYNLDYDDEAIDYLEQVITLGAGYATEYYQLMTLYRIKFSIWNDINFYSKAVHYGEKLLEQDQSATTYFVLTKTYEQGNDYNNIIVSATKALEMSQELEIGEIVYLKATLATTYRLIKDYDNCIELAEELIDSGYSWEAYNNLVKCYIHKQQYGRAIHWLKEEALIKGTNWEKIWQIYHIQGMTKEAKVAHMEMLRLPADKAKLYKASGEYFLATQNYEQAILQFDRALTANSDKHFKEIILTNLAFTYYALGDVQNTNMVLENYLETIENYNTLEFRFDTPGGKMEVFSLAEMFYYARNIEMFYKFLNLFRASPVCNTDVEDLVLSAFEAELNVDYKRALEIYDKILEKEPLDFMTIIRKELIQDAPKIKPPNIILEKLRKKKRKYATLTK